MNRRWHMHSTVLASSPRRRGATQMRSPSSTVLWCLRTGTTFAKRPSSAKVANKRQRESRGDAFCLWLATVDLGQERKAVDYFGGRTFMRRLNFAWTGRGRHAVWTAVGLVVETGLALLIGTMVGLLPVAA